MIKTFNNFLLEKTTDEYETQEYLVQPADKDTGFFMFKKQFDSLKSKVKNKKKFTPRISWKFADE